MGKIMTSIQSIGMQPSPFKGFLVRLLAAILDTVIIVIAVFGAAFTLGIFFGSLLGEGAGLGIFFLALLLSPLVTLLYKPLMEASDYQGTLGKHILNIKVVDKNGRRISMTKSFIRSIVYLLLISIPFLSRVSEAFLHSSNLVPKFKIAAFFPSLIIRPLPISITSLIEGILAPIPLPLGYLNADGRSLICTEVFIIFTNSDSSLAAITIKFGKVDK